MLILSTDATCDICLDAFEADGGKCPASLLCGHAFCRSCLYTLHTRVCPVCRQPFNVTHDMRKLHVDFESKIQREETAHELRALEVSRSGDVDQMRQQLAALESWLATAKSPNSRSSLSTVVQLLHLLMEATHQLNEALERAQAEETTSRQRSELDAMQWSKEMERLRKEIEAYQHAIGRQRERIVELEGRLGVIGSGSTSEPLLERRPSQGPPPQRVVMKSTVPPPPLAAPASSVQHGLQPPKPQYGSISPVSLAPRPPRALPSPNAPNSKTTTIMVTKNTVEASVGQTKSLSQQPQQQKQYESSKGAVMVDSTSLLARPPSPPNRSRISGSVQGPRDRALLTKGPSLNGRPPGAAPSAFLSESRPPPPPSSTTHEFSPYLLPEVLPRHMPSSFGGDRASTTNPTFPINSRRTSMPQFPYASNVNLIESPPLSIDDGRKHERPSIQPSSWRHDNTREVQEDGTTRRASHSYFASADQTQNISSWRYSIRPTTPSQSVQSHAPPNQTHHLPSQTQAQIYAPPPPHEIPTTPDTPTLSRKRALRRTRDFSPAGAMGVFQQH